jgi:hypothetical protein
MPCPIRIRAAATEIVTAAAPPAGPAICCAETTFTEKPAFAFARKNASRPNATKPHTANTGVPHGILRGAAKPR